VRQFFSEGLAAGEVLDIFGIADKNRPEISVLSDEFLDSIAKRAEHRNVQVRLLEKLLSDEIRGRTRANQMQAKLFGEEVRTVLRRYEQKQITSAEVVERLVEIAKQLRDARGRHEQLGLSEEEAAFYDALAGGVEDVKADPKRSAPRSNGCCARKATSRPRRRVPVAVEEGAAAASTRPHSLSSTRQRRSTAVGQRLKSASRRCFSFGCPTSWFGKL
jgi:hypothetical protein